MPEPLAVLANRAAAGDADARAELVERVRPLVARLAARLDTRGVRGDLEQAGMVGVLAALNGFDPARGLSFPAYAMPFAVGEMRAALRQAAPVHVSRAGRDLATAVERAVEDATVELGRPPTIGEIAARAELDEEQVVTGLSVRPALRPSSADERLIEEH